MHCIWAVDETFETKFCSSFYYACSFYKLVLRKYME